MMSSPLGSQLTTLASHATIAAVVLDGKKLRKEAAEARQMADVASNQQDRDFWLGIAEGWLKLARETDELKARSHE
jgi:hypothetical protein